jgi:hypothetical protein
MSNNLYNDNFTSLITEIEKVRRRKVINYTKDDNIQYLDPFDNLGKVKISNNHLILGRRGSGKTTLLLSTIKGDKKNLILPIDSQVFRDWTDNKIILEILIKLCESLKEEATTSQAFKEAKIKYKSEKEGVWNYCKNLLSKNEKNYDYDNYLCLSSLIKNFQFAINKIKMLPEEDFTIKVSQKQQSLEKLKIVSDAEWKATARLKATGKAPSQLVSLESNIELLSSVSNKSTKDKDAKNEKSEQFDYEKVINKTEKINDLILVFSEILSEFTKTTDKKVVLYLDDFYLIDLAIQPRVIQYFHDIYKNSKLDSFCFKICSIPNRTKINKDGKVDFSIKDDFSPIRLDKELYDFHNLKDFLLRITSNLNPNLNISTNDLIAVFSNEDVLNYTTVATGGVPRDFLVTFSELIKIARTDNASTIRKEHLYSAISDLKLDKEQNIELESDISPEKLRSALEIIQKEIIIGLKTNVILYPAKLAKEHESVLKNLVNLRYLHIINDNTSSEKIKKENFVSYLVDMTFYATGKRLKQGFEFRPFWVQDSGHRLIYLRNAPIWNFKDEFIK